MPRKKRTFIFLGATEEEVGSKILSACDLLAPHSEKTLRTITNLLRNLNRKTGSAGINCVPYTIQFMNDDRDCSSNWQVHLQAIPFDYSDELMISASLIFGAPYEVQKSLKISQVDQLKVKISQIHSAPIYREFYETIKSAFSELKLSELHTFLISCIAAILHWKSGNFDIAVEILGISNVKKFASYELEAELFPNILFKYVLHQITNSMIRASDLCFSADGCDSIAIIGVLSSPRKGCVAEITRNFLSTRLQVARRKGKLDSDTPLDKFSLEELSNVIWTLSKIDGLQDNDTCDDGERFVCFIRSFTLIQTMQLLLQSYFKTSSKWKRRCELQPQQVLSKDGFITLLKNRFETLCCQNVSIIRCSSETTDNSDGGGNSSPVPALRINSHVKAAVKGFLRKVFQNNLGVICRLCKSISCAVGGYNFSLQKFEEVPLKMSAKHTMVKGSHKVVEAEVYKKLQQFLANFSRRMENLSTPDTTVDYLDVTNFLYVDPDPSILVPQLLGGLNRFIISDSETNRTDLVNFCRASLSTYEIIKSSLDLFLNSVQVEDDTFNYYYNSYMASIIFEENQQLRPQIEIRDKFDWKNLVEDNQFMDLFFRHTLEKGSESDVYFQLLADIFSLRIDLFESDEACLRFKQKVSFNLSGKQRVLLSIDPNRVFKILSTRKDALELEKNRYFKSKISTRALSEMLKSKTTNDVALIKRKMESDDFEDIYNCEDASYCCCESQDAAYIAKAVKAKVSSTLVKGLNCLTKEKIGCNLILHILARRLRNEESMKLEVKLLKFVVNSILQCHVEGRRNDVLLIQWILAAEPVAEWMVEITLMRIETYLQKSFFTNDKEQLTFWLRSVKNNERLFQMNEAVSKSHFLEEKISFHSILDGLRCLSKIEKCPTNQTNILKWKDEVESIFRAERVEALFTNSKEEIIYTANYQIKQLTEKHSGPLVDRLLEVIELKVKSKLFDERDCEEVLNSFWSGEWSFNLVTVETLSAARDIDQWTKDIKSQSKLRTIGELIDIIKTDDDTSNETRNTLDSIYESLKLPKYQDFEVQIRSFSKMCKNYKELLESPGTINIDAVNKDPLMLLAIFDQFVFLTRKFRLKDTQKVSVMLLLQNSRSNSLLQISTGEGKTLIIVAAAIIKAFQGHQVDVVTSSTVLAKRDALANKDIYDFFGLSVDHISDKTYSELKATYSKCQVLYGSLGNFQRDYLQDHFYNKGIRCKRRFDTLILDEVDSMLLDNGQNILYLSRALPGMEKLEPIFVFIWRCVNLSPDQNVQIIRQNVLNELFGVFSRNDVKSLDPDLNEENVDQIWNKLVNCGAIYKDGTVRNFQADLHSLRLASRIETRIKYVFKQLESRDQPCSVPEFLKTFVLENLDMWIQNAFQALYMEDKSRYVFGRLADSANNSEPRIIVIDRSNGADKPNSEFSDGLHQFLQLKHGCKLSPLGIESVFSSTMGIVQSYATLFGLSGTLGFKREREYLREAYKSEVISIPTGMIKCFKEKTPISCKSENEWKKEIHEEAVAMSQKYKRSVLIVCETIQKVEMIENYFAKIGITTITYTRGHENFNYSSAKPLEKGNVIVATNLAGRGTDIRVSEEVIQNGGLHVIVSYLPQEGRTEMQAYGRAARCGEPGSARTIFMVAGAENAITKKKLRDSKTFKRMVRLDNSGLSMKIKERCFNYFQKFFAECRENFDDTFSWSTSHYQSLTNESCKTTPEEVRNIILDAILDKWSFWLYSLTKKLDQISSQSEKESMCDQVHALIAEIRKEKSYQDLLQGNPPALLKLAKYLMSKERKYKAIEIFDVIIRDEPYHSECAHYYKAMLLLRTSATGVEVCSDTYNRLTKTKKMFTRFKNESCYNAALISKISKDTQPNNTDAYKKQQENKIKIYLAFISSINQVLGHEITPSDLTCDTITRKQAEAVYESLQSWEIISKYTLNQIEKHSMKTIENGHTICNGSLYNALSSGSTCCDKDALLSKIQTASFPCVENFWDMLTSKKALLNPTKWAEIKLQELKMYDTKIYQMISARTSEQCEVSKGSVELYKSLKTENLVMIPFSIYDHSVSKITQSSLIERGIVKINQRADLNEDSLRQIDFSKICKLTPNDLCEAGIDPEDATAILSQLVQDKHLAEKGSSYVLIDPSKDIKVKCFPVYDAIVQTIVYSRFAFQLSAHLLLTDESVNCLESIVYMECRNSVFQSLTEDGHIQPPHVQCLKEVSGGSDCKCFEVKESNLQRFLPAEIRTSDNASFLLKTLLQRRSVRCLPNASVSFEYVHNAFDDYKTNEDLQTHIAEFSRQGLDTIVKFSAEVNEWSWLGFFAVLGLAIVQLAIGEMMKVQGNFWMGSALVLEGFSDLKFAWKSWQSGSFSWGNYAKHKFFSLLQTAAATGIGYFISLYVPFGTIAEGFTRFYLGKATAVLYSEIFSSVVFKNVCSKLLGYVAWKKLFEKEDHSTDPLDAATKTVIKESVTLQDDASTQIDAAFKKPETKRPGANTENENTKEEEKRDSLDLEMQRMIDILSKTQTAKELADVIATPGVAMEVASVMAATEILRERLGTQVELVVTNADSGHEFTFTNSAQVEGSVRVIRITLTNGHFVHSSGTNRVQSPGRNDCLYEALATEVDLELTAEQFRRRIAELIRTNQDLVVLVQRGVHREFLRRRFIGGDIRRDRDKEKEDQNDKHEEKEKGTSTKCNCCGYCKFFTFDETSYVFPSGNAISIKGTNTCRTKKVIYMVTIDSQSPEGGTCTAYYVGRTTREARQRFAEHLRSLVSKKKNTLGRHAEAHGFERVQVVVLEQVGAEDSIADREQVLIDRVREEVEQIPDGLFLNVVNARRQGRRGYVVRIKPKRRVPINKKKLNQLRKYRRDKK